MNNAVARAAGLVGVAAAGAVLTALHAAGLDAALAVDPRLLLGVDLHADGGQAVIASYLDAYRAAMLLCALIAAMAAAIAWFGFKRQDAAKTASL